MFSILVVVANVDGGIETRVLEGFTAEYIADGVARTLNRSTEHHSQIYTVATVFQVR